MAVIEVACNLSSSLFPFATEMWGRSIMFPQLDENYNRTVFSTVDPGYEKQVPQVFYMHNVMPTTLGYQAIGFSSDVVFADPALSFDAAFPIQTAKQVNYIYVPASGRNWIYSANTKTWTSISPFPDGTITSSTQVTTAFVHGQTYIYFSGVGNYIYDDVGNTLVHTPLAGLDETKVLGICAANGYMIAVSVDAVAWSSLIDPTDFVPSLITGAGGGSVNDAKGAIVAALQIAGGFIVYCEKNAVGATYTGNSSFPFIFLEVAGSGGINTTEQISYQANMATHTMLGSYGIQELTKTTSKLVYPEATDFFAGQLFEDFNEVLQQFSSEYIGINLSTKLHIIESRYVCISYGKVPGAFTHVLVWDLAFKRWGKLKIDHVDCFEWNFPNFSGNVTYGQLLGRTYGSLVGTSYGDFSTQTKSNAFPRKSIAFLESNGCVHIVDFDFSESTAVGVFAIGKFQFRRRNKISHQYTTIDTVNAGESNFSFNIIPTYDGKTFRPFVPGFFNAARSGSKSRMYQKIVSGMNITLLLQGQFNLSSIVAAFTIEGPR